MKAGASADVGEASENDLLEHPYSPFRGSVAGPEAGTPGGLPSELDLQASAFDVDTPEPAAAPAIAPTDSSASRSSYGDSPPWQADTDAFDPLSDLIGAPLMVPRSPTFGTPLPTHVGEASFLNNQCRRRRRPRHGRAPASSPTAGAVASASAAA